MRERGLLRNYNQYTVSKYPHKPRMGLFFLKSVTYYYLTALLDYDVHSVFDVF